VIGQIVLWTFFNDFGNAEHIWNVKPSEVSHYFLICWIIQIVYPIGLGLIKVSALFLYYELFPSDNFRVLIFCVMGFVGTMTTAFVFVLIFQCTPVQEYWVMAMSPTRHCIDAGRLSTMTSALSFGTDIFILVMPIKYLIALRISTREELQLIVLMSLGSFTCIASIMRFKAIREVYNSTDATWNGFDLSIWSSFEYHLAIITACIPTIKPLWVRGIRKILIIVRGGKVSTSQESSETPRPKFMQPEPKFPV